MAVYLKTTELLAVAEAIEFARSLQTKVPSSILEVIKEQDLRIFLAEDQNANGEEVENGHIEFYKDFGGLSFLFVYDSARISEWGLYDITFQLDRCENHGGPLSEYLAVSLEDGIVEISES